MDANEETRITRMHANEETRITRMDANSGDSFGALQPSLNRKRME